MLVAFMPRHHVVEGEKDALILTQDSSVFFELRTLIYPLFFVALTEFPSIGN